MPIKLIIVDDNIIQGEGLSKLLSASDKIHFKGNIPSPELCLEALATDSEIDLILLDIHFPTSELSGIDLVDKIRAKYPFQNEKGEIIGPRIIFFSVETAGFVDEEKGVFGLIPKNADFSTIVSMVDMVCRFGATFPPENKVNAQPKFWSSLSKKEKQIFELILLGKPTKEIAEELNPGPSTVDKYRKKILSKLKNAGLKVQELKDNRVSNLISKHKDCLKIWKGYSKNEKEILRHLIYANSLQKVTLKSIQKILDVLGALGLDFRDINDPEKVRLAKRHDEIFEFWKAFSKKEKDIIHVLIKARSISDFGTNNLKNIVKSIGRFNSDQDLVNHPQLIQLLMVLEGSLSFWKALSKKEQELIFFFAEGKSNEETAREIIPSQLTVITHRKNILRKIKDSGLKVDKIDDPRLVKLVLDYGLCKVGSL